MRLRALALLGLCLCLLGAAADSAAAAGFGIASASVELKGGAGSPLQAGGHPDLSVAVGFDVEEGPRGKVVSGQLKSFELDLPPGAYVDPHATPLCSMEELSSEVFCPPDTQVGVVRVDLPEPQGGAAVPIYNMTPARDEPISLAASVYGVPQRFRVSLRGEDGYAARVTASPINAGVAVAHIDAELWGVPEASEHDGDRCQTVLDPCPSSHPQLRPFLTLPTRCEPLSVELRARSWEQPEAWQARTLTTAPLTGCDSLRLSPELRVHPTTDLADSPTGLDVELRLPQSEDPDGTTTAQPRDARIVLPEGLVFNPSFAHGLGVCTPAQIGLIAPAPTGESRFDDAPATCPASSRIGTAAVSMPLLAESMQGAIYLAEPDRNPYGALLAVYLDFSGAGINVKVPALLSPDPITGRLTISLRGLPQLPLSAITMSFAGGDAAALRSPPLCADYETAVALTPWSAPEGPSVGASGRFEISRSPAPGPCPTSPATLPNTFAFQAGASSAVAGASGSFGVDLRRPDGSGQLSRLSFSPPPGLVARLGDVATCPDQDILAAQARGGREEQREPSCPASSKVGSIDVAAGAGATPYRLSGSVYLAGPYDGAPASLAAIVPAVAGPLDLGVVAIRSTFRLNPKEARIVATTDPLPAVLRGIPLDPREISLRLDRPGFVANPTSCAPLAVEASALSPAGAVTPLKSRFQVGGCSGLPFAPRLALRLAGPVHRSAHPSLRIGLRMPAHGANLARLALTLPPGLYVDGNRAQAPCSLAAYDAGECPAASRIGYATVWTPLLRRALTGPVYLRASQGRLPDVVASLDGRFHLDLVGKVDSVGGRIRATFPSIPDVPVSRLRLVAFGGRRGLLVAGTRLCRVGSRAAASFVAHDAVSLAVRPKVETGCERGTRALASRNTRSP